MATTTPNFGWSVPTSTDLVKDGATAIETLGDAIDASLLDLKGGTSGQVLAKNSNTDMDFVWVAQDDSNAIQNAIVDAKGDLIAASASDTPARLAVGANDTVLTADSSTATGLKWAAPAGSSGPAFSVYLSANQSVGSSADTKVTYNTTLFDTDTDWDNTNKRFTPSKAGYYQFNVHHAASGTSVTRQQLFIYKNGTKVARFFDVSAADPYIYTGSYLMYLNGTTDYAEVFAQVSASSGAVFIGGQEYSGFNGVWIRS